MNFDRFFAKIAQRDYRTSLHQIEHACRLLNGPEQKFPSIHVAGTNGKGSTSAFLASILQGSGLRVGLMTSPHLLHVCERLQINRTPIAPREFERLTLKIVGHLPHEEYLSYFEMITLIGFLYFAEQQVDCAVVEVGLGGRLDATNVIRPKVAVITSLGMDHEKILGNSLPAIAREKCGIIKRGVAVVSAPQPAEAIHVIEAECAKNNAELFCLDSRLRGNDQYPLGLAGEHQKINAACALQAAELFLGKKLLAPVAKRALAQTVWPGRLSWLQRNPDILADCAHNPAGMATLVNYLRKYEAHRKIHFLVGAMKDKDVAGLLEPLLPLAQSFTCVAVQTDRAMDPLALAGMLSAAKVPVKATFEPIAKVFPIVVRQLREGDLLVVTGSIYVIGEVYALQEKSKTA